MTSIDTDTAALLPDDHQSATLVGRVFDPQAGGPCVVHLRDDGLADVTDSFPTMTHLLEQPRPAEAVAAAGARRHIPLADALAGTNNDRDNAALRLLAPCDLQAVKACGVTFASSMLERVIEERAAGIPERAHRIREELTAAVGGTLDDIQAGSEQARQAKALLEEAGLWSQYLEVGIGPDAEVFTKAQILSAVGTGARIGVLQASAWNNPEPEVVLAVTSRGEAVGATLGNDVNLRDFEGRSALLLSKAKDNNASCALGPMIRLFDDDFDMDDVSDMAVDLRIEGADGYQLHDQSQMRQISRTPEELVRQTIGASHQYPDGLVLFLGTLFAPTADRDEPGMGFTHTIGDRVHISTPRLGTLSNEVAHCETLPPWTFGVRALIENLAERGLLGMPAAASSV
jgi:fumarylacetoacetate (FAA) hydrolase family protein